ncbi:MarR family transcriptional regulator [uncultured Dubosiella sp.]|uniref:MarR family winged helix-turn-helix transcriptional regulator n=2 Tax=uncultured Dubosiella sp. TaxID=1937011 RepID=UPI00263BBD17|nr:MarR family transcriptional regulator [uncultured Dubosiella sp.]
MIENTCGFLIKQINDILEKKGNQEMEMFGITMSQHSVLMFLDILDFKELERKLHVAQSTTAGIVKRLEQKDLVEVVMNLQDRRAKQVRLTKKGQACIEISRKKINEVERDLLSSLNDQEKEELYELLSKVRNHL